MNRLKVHDPSQLWEDLRKQACQLENEVDLKLVSFSKLGTNYSSYRDSYDSNGSDSSQPNKANTAQLFDHMSLDIEQLLSSLGQVNDRLTEFTRSPAGGASNATSLHTLQRHWDILQDYTHEFRKIRDNVCSLREREQLLDLGHRDSSYKNSGATDLYLKEHDHLLSSDRLVDEQINVALATRENLQGQKSSLYGITDKVSALANRFPVINSVMQKINFRKRRDAIILALVVAVCTIFLLWYALAR